MGLTHCPNHFSPRPVTHNLLETQDCHGTATWGRILTQVRLQFRALCFWTTGVEEGRPVIHLSLYMSVTVHMVVGGGEEQVYLIVET